jgi:hypothetical protein
MSATRRLAAILAADVAGFSRLIEEDESGTLQAIRGELIDPALGAHNGPFAPGGVGLGVPEPSRHGERRA